jgi:hypothetical protein
MREELIKCWLLANKNDVLSPVQESQRRQAMLDDFRLLNQCVAHFRGSEIQGRIHSGDPGLLFSIWLVERSQLELEMRGIRLSADLFASELKELKNSVIAEPEMVANALSPLLDAAQLRELVRSHPEVASLRLRARARMTRTPVIDEAGLKLFQCTLPRGGLVQIMANVHDLKPRVARLFDVKVVSEHEHLPLLEFPRFIEMSRPTVNDSLGVNEALVQALDSQTPLSLTVLIDFDSATGQPARLSFRKLEGC